MNYSDFINEALANFEIICEEEFNAVLDDFDAWDLEFAGDYDEVYTSIDDFAAFILGEKYSVYVDYVNFEKKEVDFMTPYSEEEAEELRKIDALLTKKGWKTDANSRIEDFHEETRESTLREKATRYLNNLDSKQLEEFCNKNNIS